MKKENLVKKALSKALIGFPIGITLLMISYISIYFFTNQSIFNSEMYQLHNIKTLILQIMSAGISGYILIVSLFLCLQMDNIFLSQKPYISLLTIIVSLLCMSIIITILGNSKIFSENIRTLNLTIMILFFSLASLVLMIKKAIEKYWIKKINKKLQKGK
jgi:magnesium-transporting ATPase (P-type)